MATGKVHTTDSSRPFKQDLPPKGGYEPINFKRIPARQLVNAKILIPTAIAMQLFGFWTIWQNRRIRSRREVEKWSTHLALEPLMLAERDRAFLKQLRLNREYEAELMKDVPGWEVGTWFGQKVFATEPDDKLISPTLYEFYIHSSERQSHVERHYRDTLISD